MPFDENMRKAFDEVGEIPLRTAFRQAIFVYGTTGTGSLIGKILKQMMIQARGPNQATLSFYDPGPRTAFALANQMMDLYYGMKGVSLHENRIPTIGAYVHRAMGFKGQFRMGEA